MSSIQAVHVRRSPPDLNPPLQQAASRTTHPTNGTPTHTSRSIRPASPVNPAKGELICIHDIDARRLSSRTHTPPGNGTTMTGEAGRYTRKGIPGYPLDERVFNHLKRAELWCTAPKRTPAPKIPVQSTLRNLHRSPNLTALLSSSYAQRRAELHLLTECTAERNMRVPPAFSISVISSGSRPPEAGIAGSSCRGALPGRENRTIGGRRHERYKKAHTTYILTNRIVSSHTGQERATSDDIQIPHAKEKNGVQA
ncbi:hypothetical protein R3P38DRAFT_3374261 [Favolaschia claudopus]|uniref:Uncharacterized protein n=1 Tax=Favolaschia claudopus TaxID=2862362 RepID=A0AAV9ZNE7_9AGAR